MTSSGTKSVRHEAFEEIMVPIPQHAPASADAANDKGKAPLQKQASGIGAFAKSKKESGKGKKKKCFHAVHMLTCPHSFF